MSLEHVHADALMIGVPIKHIILNKEERLCPKESTLQQGVDRKATCAETPYWIWAYKMFFFAYTHSVISCLWWLLMWSPNKKTRSWVGTCAHDKHCASIRFHLIRIRKTIVAPTSYFLNSPWPPNNKQRRVLENFLFFDSWFTLESVHCNTQ